ncbi:MAG: hypothetical protein JXK93_10750 [Sphaerochaetaceae bacterium]|nr:hypothetical protein [Sphaerochaetaceae bacterium]
MSWRMWASIQAKEDQEAHQRRGPGGRVDNRHRCILFDEGRYKTIYRHDGVRHKHCNL